MRPIKMRLFLWIGLLLFSAHFLLIALYKLKPNSVSSQYVYPYFHQSWELFVPPPESNYHLYARDKNGFIMDVFTDILHRHQENRLAGNEALVLAISNSIHYFESEDRESIRAGKVVNDINFEIIDKLAKNYLQSNYNISPDNVSFILQIIPINNPLGQRIYYN